MCGQCIFRACLFLCALDREKEVGFNIRFTQINVKLELKV